MSKFKSEVLPSGVLIRKIKDDDNNYVLTCQGQAIIVSKLDIARMYGIVYPTRRLSEKCCNVAPKTEESVNAEQAWHDVSQKLLESELKQRTTNNCIACTIQERDEQVKQMPRHTCEIDGTNRNSAEWLKAEYKHIEQETDAYEAEVMRIAEVLARIEYKKCKYVLISWEYLMEAAKVDNYDLTGINYKAQKEELIREKTQEARAMVAEMAKQYEFAYFSNYDGNEDSEDYVVWNQNCIDEMKERGLIP